MQPAPPKPDTFLVRSLHVFALVGFAIAQPMYDLLGRHPEFFVARQSQPIDIWLMIAALSIGLPLLIVVIEMLVAGIGRRIRLPLKSIARFIIVGALITLIALPILKRVELLQDPILIALALGLGLAGALAYSQVALLRRFITIVSIAGIVFPMLFIAIPGIQSSLFSQKSLSVSDTATRPQQSSTKLAPVVMIIFDELPSTSLMTDAGLIDAQRFPNFAALASNAHWFRNASTVADSTLMSLPAILTGQRPATSKLATAADYPDNLFTWLAQTHSLNVTETVTRLCPDELCAGNAQSLDLASRLQPLADDLAIIYQHQTLPGDYTRHLPAIDYAWKHFNKGEQVVVKLSDLAKQAAVKVQQDRQQMFDNFVASIGRDEAPGLLFFHSMLPHSPYDYLPSGKLYGVSSSLPGINNGIWTDDAWLVDKSYQRHLLQVGFVDKLLGRLIRRLKDQQLYDNAVIIVVSDHGVSFESNKRTRAVSIENAHNIMPVPFFIKLPDQTTGQIHDFNTSLLDVMPTLASALDTTLPWSVDGQSALNIKAERDEAKSISYSRGRKKVDLDLQEFIQRRQRVIQHKTALLRSADNTPGLLVHSSAAALIGQPINTFKVSASSDLTVVFDQQRFFENHDPTSNFVPARITGHINLGDTPSPEFIAISVNGTLWALDKPTHLEGTVATLQSFVPEAAFAQGHNDVTAWLAQGWPDTELTLVPLKTQSEQPKHFHLQKSWLGKVQGLINPDGDVLPLENTDLDGWLDQVRTQDGVVMFSGWAAKKDRSKAVDQIALFVDGHFLFAGKPNMVRIDVQLSTIDGATQRAGFRFYMPLDTIASGVTKDVRAFAISQEGEVVELQYPHTFQWLQQLSQ